MVVVGAKAWEAEAKCLLRHVYGRAMALAEHRALTVQDVTAAQHHGEPLAAKLRVQRPGPNAYRLPRESQNPTQQLQAVALNPRTLIPEPGSLLCHVPDHEGLPQLRYNGNAFSCTRFRDEESFSLRPVGLKPKMHWLSQTRRG